MEENKVSCNYEEMYKQKVSCNYEEMYKQKEAENRYLNTKLEEQGKCY